MRGITETTLLKVFSLIQLSVPQIFMKIDTVFTELWRVLYLRTRVRVSKAWFWRVLL